MSATAQKLQAIVDSKADIADAIEERGGTVPTKLSEYGDAIRNLPEDVEPADVEFIDYDGTVLYKYTFAEANELTELPDYTSLNKPGIGTGYTMVCEGWNYTLAEVKRHASAGIKVTVGCTYVTSDNKLRIHVHIDDPNDRKFGFSVGQTVTKYMSIAFGDPNDTSDDQATPGTTNPLLREHTYSTTGDFIITVGKSSVAPVSATNVVNISGNICGSNLRYGKKITAVEFGCLNTISGLVFRCCDNLSYASIPASTTNAVSGTVFRFASGLKAFVLPRRDSSYMLPQQMFGFCSSLEKVSIPTSISMIGTDVSDANKGQSFSDCTSLKYIAIPDTVEDLCKGTFSGCTSLKKVYCASPKIHANTFYRCSSLNSFKISSGNSAVGGSDFYCCADLEHVYADSPIHATGDGCFRECTSLKSVPELNLVSKEMFYLCSSLEEAKVSYHPTAPIAFPYTFMASTGISVYTYTIDSNLTVTGGSGSVDGSYFTVSDYTATDDVYVVFYTTTGSAAVEINKTTGACVALPSAGGPFLSSVAVTSDKIGDSAFKFSNLGVLDLSDCTAIPVIGSQSFNDIVTDTRYIVPAGQGNIWKAATGWSSFAAKIEEAS